jgi:hypothetical protein
MDHLRWGLVSVSAKAKACADFGHLGHCHFPGLVLPATVSELLESAKAAEYHPIFNELTKKFSKRAAAKADDLGALVIRQVFEFLKGVFIAGPLHVLEMARGATFLRSLPGVGKQDTHTDFDFVDIIPPPGFRRGKPFSIWIALADDSCLWLAGKLETYKAGDVVIFAGDCSHSGAANTGKQCNYRLFSYVPTREFEVPWDFHRCTTKVKGAANEVSDEKEVARLHVDTNALSAKFKPDEYLKYLFDRKTCKFYTFTIPLWIEGLDTAVPDQPAYSKGLYVPPKVSSATGCSHCPHFDVEDFSPTTQDERQTLNTWRTQCVYCKPLRQKKKRLRGDES